MMEAFKQTDIGLIPEDWDFIRAEDIFVRVTDGTHDTPTKLDEGYPLVTSKSIKNGSIDESVVDYFISKEDYFEVNRRSKVDKNDILFSMIGTVGEVALVRNDPIYAIKNIGLFKSNSFELSEYCYYWFQSPLAITYVNNSKSGSTQKYIPLFKLRYFPIALPAPDERKKIAHVLSKIQQAIETQEQIIKTTQELKKALMQKLFTEGLNGEPQKQTEIGPFPESWNVVSIGDICEQRKENYSPNPNGNSIYVGLEHIISGEYYLSNYSYENKVVSSKYKFYEDDLLYGKLRPYLDKAVLVNKNGICSTDIIVIKPKINNHFLLALLHWEPLLKHSIAHTSGVNHPRTSFDALSKFKFALPNPTTQKTIGDSLFKLEDKIMLHRNLSNQMKDVFSSMLNQLMTGQIRLRN